MGAVRAVIVKNKGNEKFSQIHQQIRKMGQCYEVRCYGNTITKNNPTSLPPGSHKITKLRNVLRKQFFHNLRTTIYYFSPYSYILQHKCQINVNFWCYSGYSGHTILRVWVSLSSVSLVFLFPFKCGTHGILHRGKDNSFKYQRHGSFAT